MTRIEPATLAQLDALCALHATSFPRGWRPAEMETFIRDPTVVALVALGDDEPPEPFGLAMARHAAGEAEILTIVIAPQRRRQGHARHLLDALCMRLDELDVSELLLEVAQNNNPACMLYDASGFRRVGARPAYYAGPGGGDAVIMRRALAAIDGHGRR